MTSKGVGRLYLVASQFRHRALSDFPLIVGSLGWALGADNPAQNCAKRAPRGSQEASRPRCAERVSKKNCKNTQLIPVGPFLALFGPQVGAHIAVMLAILSQNLVPFCLLAWKRLLHGFCDGFWGASEPSKLCFRLSENTILTFSSRSLLASFSTSKTSPKSIPKRCQEGPKKLPDRCEKRCAKQVSKKSVQ